MAKNGDKSKQYPPIISASTFTSFIESLKNTKVPPVIDASLLPKMSGSVRSSLMSALRYLNLIDSAGIVNERLRTLVKAYQTEDWKAVFGDIVRVQYHEIVNGIDLESGTANQLYEAFRTKGNVDGQMLEKAVRFYLATLSEAGWTFSPHFKSRTIRKNPAKRRTAKKQSAATDDYDDEHEMELIGPVGEFDELLSARFQIPIPGDKGDAIIVLPRSIDEDDWQMVRMMLDAYVQRLMKTKD